MSKDEQKIAFSELIEIKSTQKEGETPIKNSVFAR
jgi:hypothetical protein